MADVVGVYVRISIDRSGRREGVAAQEKWGRAYAAAHWPDAHVRVFSDNNLSAARDDVRPGYEELRTAIRAGELTHLWCVEQSRLERRESGRQNWFELAAELDAAGISELHTRRNGIVRVRDDVAGILAVINAGEVRRLKRRVNDKLSEIAAQGRPSGGVMFGYKRAVTEDGEKTFAIVPEQAEALRWAADAVLRGWSLTNIAAELSARGHRGARGGPMVRTAVRGILRSRTIAGQRVYRGVHVGPGNWDPIISEEVWRSVQRKLDEPRVVTCVNGTEYVVKPAQFGSRTGRKYVLTGGLVRCGVCSAALIGTMRRLDSAPRVRYMFCSPSHGGKACVGLHMDPLEEHVLDSLFARLDNPEFLQAIAADEHAVRRDALAQALAEVDAQRSEIMRERTRQEITKAEWEVARRELDASQRALRAELAMVPPPVIGLDVAGARELWPDMTLDEQRAFVRMFVEQITVNRATPGLPRRPFDPELDPDRVVIDWQFVG